MVYLNGVSSFDNNFNPHHDLATTPPESNHTSLFNLIIDDRIYELFSLEHRIRYFFQLALFSKSFVCDGFIIYVI